MVVEGGGGGDAPGGLHEQAEGAGDAHGGGLVVRLEVRDIGFW